MVRAGPVVVQVQFLALFPAGVGVAVARGTGRKLRPAGPLRWVSLARQIATAMLAVAEGCQAAGSRAFAGQLRERNRQIDTG